MTINRFFSASGSGRLLLVLLLSIRYSAQGQQNLFNIPAGDLTPQGKVFFQHQTNIYNRGYFESKNHFVYGLGKGWEAGLNVVNLQMNFRRGRKDWLGTNPDNRSIPLAPLVKLTSQKFFFLSDRLSTSIGTQVGLNPIRFSGVSRELTHFSYNTWAWIPRSHVKVVAGPYLSDRGTLGAGNRAGLLLGAEFPVTKKLLFMGDFISGNNYTSASVVGFNYLATKRLQLCLGALLPNPGTSNRPGLVFELNLLGYDDPH
ncbi:hypothetical protein SAMN02745146_1733 [Hymenobacter daecheongensis DSM 21074]|uniref:MetA-pathway of phenol degradation n=1 Tax=Hymenobacter daecheongensis DSM 21074 TaxID=1121955 RepID=A0A1M6ELG9_9BACT|nr:hypothetical protein [Hymenobacter daecheongensis]SHI86331.1 hypothetical protein SAMN02745146_1733 [Hymenobacter daecheongensis DSM 21074]